MWYVILVILFANHCPLAKRVSFLLYIQGRTEPNIDDQLLADSKMERQSPDVELGRLRRSLGRSYSLPARLEARHYPLQ